MKTRPAVLLPIQSTNQHRLLDDPAPPRYVFILSPFYATIAEEFNHGILTHNHKQKIKRQSHRAPMSMRLFAACNLKLKTMKTKYIFTVAAMLSVLLFATLSHAADITATNNGNWGDPTIWMGGAVPGINDDADIPVNINVIVNTNASVQYIYDNGTVTMAAGATLNIVGDPAGAEGTYQLGSLDTSAVGNTVIYSGNPFWAKHQNYYNLVFSNSVATNQQDFFNGVVNSQDPAAAMTIAGSMTVIGKIKVQQGADITVDGNLTIGTNSSWDCSSFNLTVTGNTVVTGLLLDLNGALGTNNFLGNMTVNHSAAGGWNLGDVIYWNVGGSLTNNGLIAGIGYASIAFNGTGNIAGSAIKIPTLTVNGTYTIGTTITLTTNTPTLNGTLVFDLANPQKIILPANVGTSLYYSGNLNVINSGPPPTSGATYQFFNAPSYGGAFTSTSFPSLPAGLSWVDNTLVNGSIAVQTGGGRPTLGIASSGGLVTLSWDTTTFPGFHVQAQTNWTGWVNPVGGTVSPFSIPIGPVNQTVVFRLSNP